MTFMPPSDEELTRWEGRISNQTDVCIHEIRRQRRMLEAANQAPDKPRERRLRAALQLWIDAEDARNSLDPTVRTVAERDRARAECIARDVLEEVPIQADERRWCDTNVVRPPVGEPIVVLFQSGSVFVSTIGQTTARPWIGDYWLPLPPPPPGSGIRKLLKA